MFAFIQLVLGGVSCGNQSNCRICILIGECCTGVDSPGDTGICRIAWKGWKVMNDWNVWNVSGVSGMTGMSGKTGKTGMSGMSGKTGKDWNVWNVWKDWNVCNICSAFGRSCGWNAWNVFVTHGCFCRRSPCLLCVEFLFWILDSHQ